MPTFSREVIRALRLIVSVFPGTRLWDEQAWKRLVLTRTPPTQHRMRGAAARSRHAGIEHAP